MYIKLLHRNNLNIGVISGHITRKFVNESIIVLVQYSFFVKIITGGRGSEGYVLSTFGVFYYLFLQIWREEHGYQIDSADFLNSHDLKIKMAESLNHSQKIFKNKNTS